MRVERLRQAFALEVVYRHFPLHPETPEAGLSLAELFAGRNIDVPAAQAKLAKLMADEGLPYGERTMTYNSRLAQELAAWAVTKPAGEKIHDALFRAYFVDNVNLAVVDNLVAIAEQIGLPSGEAREVLNGRTFRNAVDDDWQRSRSLGITGVPTFVVGNQGVVGAQTYEQLAEFATATGVELRCREA